MDTEESSSQDASNPAKSIADLRKDTKRHEQIIYLVIIVLFVGMMLSAIGVGAVLESYLASRQATYEDLKDQVTAQNAKIDALTDEIRSKTNP